MDNKDLIDSELPAIAELVRRKAADEERRRGCHVSPHDPVVQQGVAADILTGMGEVLRATYERRAH